MHWNRIHATELEGHINIYCPDVKDIICLLCDVLDNNHFECCTVKFTNYKGECGSDIIESNCNVTTQEKYKLVWLSTCNGHTIKPKDLILV